jgi:hypothetical protein
MIIIIMRGENFVAHLDGLGCTPVAHLWLIAWEGDKPICTKTWPAYSFRQEESIGGSKLQTSVLIFVVFEIVKFCFFAVRTELLNNSRVPAVLLQGTIMATVAIWMTVATWWLWWPWRPGRPRRLGDRGVRATLATCETRATWARQTSLSSYAKVRFG